MNIENAYHYTECGLENIYLVNGFNTITTPRGKAISVNDVDGLHKAIGLHIVNFRKALSAQDICFLRHEMLMSQSTLASLLGVTEQTIRRWEQAKVAIAKPSESLLRLIYREHVQNQESRIAKMLQTIAQLEDTHNDKPVFFLDTQVGWTTAA